MRQNENLATKAIKGVERIAESRKQEPDAPIWSEDLVNYKLLITNGSSALRADLKRLRRNT